MKISECIKELSKIQNLQGDIEVGYNTGMDFAFLHNMYNTIYYPDDGNEIHVVSMKFEYE
jgi:hypothetical protein